MSSATREIVDELLRRMAAGDHDRTAELFDEPIDWQLAWPVEGHPAVPWVRRRSSRADVADHCRSLEAHHVPELTSDCTPAVVDAASRHRHTGRYRVDLPTCIRSPNVQVILHERELSRMPFGHGLGPVLWPSFCGRGTVLGRADVRVTDHQLQYAARLGASGLHRAAR